MNYGGFLFMAGLNNTTQRLWLSGSILQFLLFVIARGYRLSHVSVAY